MEPKFQSSFIPKKPIVSTQSTLAPVVRTTNIFSLIAGVVFVTATLVSGGLFFYKSLINKQILESDKAVNDARSAFQTEKIQELIDANSRMMSTNGLLQKHVAVSKLLTFLQQATLKKVRFDEFIYKNEGDSPSISMKVESQSYNALASQGEIFSKSEFIKNPYFYDFSPQENGFVRASFSSAVDTKLVSYKEKVSSLPTTQ